MRQRMHAGAVIAMLGWLLLAVPAMAAVRSASASESSPYVSARNAMTPSLPPKSPTCCGGSSTTTRRSRWPGR